MVSLIEYADKILIALGGILTFVLGRKSSKILEKKQQAEAIDTMQKTYDMFLVHYQKQYDRLVEDNRILHNKQDNLNRQFAELQLSYAKEIENSQNWEKLHRELEKQHSILEKKYEGLEKLYEKLKADFEKYKKQVK
jgi:DNA repair exonuclease SbcCD ATPase subunit